MTARTSSLVQRLYVPRPGMGGGILPKFLFMGRYPKEYFLRKSLLNVPIFHEFSRLAILTGWSQKREFVRNSKFNIETVSVEIS